MGDRDGGVQVVLYDSDYGFAANIIKNLYLGPGEPGPGDEWKMPPVDAARTTFGEDEGGAEGEPEPAESARKGGRLRRLIHRG